MKTTTPPQGDAALGQLLRDARPAPGLPPRFQENVWRRIERNEAPAAVTWVEALAALVLKPRLVIAAVCALALAGVLLGAWDGSARVRDLAQMRYVESVTVTLSP